MTDIVKEEHADYGDWNNWSPRPRWSEVNVGATFETVTVQSFEDILNVGKERITKERIRTIELKALVDTGASHLCLSPSAIAHLGLRLSRTRRIQTANGVVERRIFGGADITILGRTEQMSVMENDAETPPLIGFMVLEALDLIVDPTAEKLIPNPEHGGKWTTYCL